MRVLFLDTSSQIASVSAFEDDKYLGEFTVFANRTHSQRVMPMIDAFLKQVDLKTSDFDAFGVCVGPGSFTGVRIGISTIKAFAQVHDKPVYTLTSMALLAGHYHFHEGVIAVANIANKDEVYYGFYQCESGCLKTLQEGVLPLDAVFELALAYDKILWTGDGLVKTPPVGGVAAQKYMRTSSANAHFWMPSIEPAVSYRNVTADYFKKSQAERDLK